MNKQLHRDRCLHMEMNGIGMMLLQLTGTKKILVPAPGTVQFWLY